MSGFKGQRNQVVISASQLSTPAISIDQTYMKNMHANYKDLFEVEIKNHHQIHLITNNNINAECRYYLYVTTIAHT